MNKNIFNTILKVVTAVIFVIGVFLSLKVMMNGDPKNVDAEQLGIVEWNAQLDKHIAGGGTEANFSTDKAPEQMGDEIADELIGDINSGVSTTIDFTLIILWICVGVSLLSFLYATVTDFKRFVPFLIGTVVLLIIIGISYAMSSDVVPADLMAKTDAKTYKLVGTGIMASIILTALAGIGWVVGEALKLIK